MVPFLSFFGGRLQATGYRLQARGTKKNAARTCRVSAVAFRLPSGSTRAIGIPRFDEAGILRPRLTERTIRKSRGDAVVDCRGPSDLISLAGHIHHLLSTPLTSFAFGVLRQVRTLGGQSPRTPVHCSCPAEWRGRSPAIRRDACNTILKRLGQRLVVAPARGWCGPAQGHVLRTRVAVGRSSKSSAAALYKNSRRQACVSLRV